MKLLHVEEKTIKKEVKDQFDKFVASLNAADAGAWSRFYSRDDFLSTVAGVDCYGSRSEWIDTVTSYFTARESQHVEPLEVRITALTPSLALVVSQEKSEIVLKSGMNVKSRHVFTMIWRKEQDGWKILHSHESWVDEQAER